MSGSPRSHWVALFPRCSAGSCNQSLQRHQLIITSQKRVYLNRPQFDGPVEGRCEEKMREVKLTRGAVESEACDWPSVALEYVTYSGLAAEQST